MPTVDRYKILTYTAKPILFSSVSDRFAWYSRPQLPSWTGSIVAVRSAAATSPAVYMGARKAAPKRKVAPKKKVARKVQLTPRAPRKSQPRPPFLYHRNLRPAAAGAATRLPPELPFFSHLSARRRRRRW